MVAVWREADCFGHAERAALAWCEALTLLPSAGAPDELFEELRLHSGPSQRPLGRLGMGVERPGRPAWALRLSLGLDVGRFEPVATNSPVDFYYAWLPPVGDWEIRAMRVFDAIVSLPQVDRAWLNRRAGDRVSSRDGGMFGHLAAAYGAVATHEELWPLVAEVASAPSFALRPLPRRRRASAGVAPAV